MPRLPGMGGGLTRPTRPVTGLETTAKVTTRAAAGANSCGAGAKGRDARAARGRAHPGAPRGAAGAQTPCGTGPPLRLGGPLPLPPHVRRPPVSRPPQILALATAPYAATRHPSTLITPQKHRRPRSPYPAAVRLSSLPLGHHTGCPPQEGNAPTG